MAAKKTSKVVKVAKPVTVKKVEQKLKLDTRVSFVDKSEPDRSVEKPTEVVLTLEEKEAMRLEEENREKRIYLMSLINKFEKDKDGFYTIMIGNGKVAIERKSKLEPFLVLGKASLIDALKAMEKHDDEL